MKKFKGLIFDFNGVLLWDTHLHDEAWREFSKKLRGHPLAHDEMVQHVHGQPNKNVQEYLLGRPVPKEESQKFLEEKEALYKNACLALGSEFKLSPGAIELLEQLRRKKVPFTIATSSEIGNVRFFFDHLHLGTWFDMDAVAFDDGTFPGKPAPDIYLKAARILSLRPEDCVVIEDARSGIAAAHAAGTGHIVAIGPKEMHETLMKIEGVNEVVEKLSEVDVPKLFD